MKPIVSPSLEALKEAILTECKEDYVGIWSVIRDAQDCFPNEDHSSIRHHVLGALQELLLAKKIKAGIPTTDGRGFRNLDGSPEEIVACIEAEWPASRCPTIGEGLWFTA